MGQNIPKTAEEVGRYLCAASGKPGAHPAAVQKSLYLAASPDEVRVWLEAALDQWKPWDRESQPGSMAALFQAAGSPCVLWAQWYPVGQGTHGELTLWSLRRRLGKSPCDVAFRQLWNALPPGVAQADTPRVPLEHPLTSGEAEQLLVEALGGLNAALSGGRGSTWAAKRLKTYHAQETCTLQGEGREVMRLLAAGLGVLPVVQLFEMPGYTAALTSPIPNPCVLCLDYRGHPAGTTVELTAYAKEGWARIHTADKTIAAFLAALDRARS